MIYSGKNDENIKIYKDKLDTLKTVRLLKHQKIKNQNNFLTQQTLKNHLNYKKKKFEGFLDNIATDHISMGLGGLEKIQGVERAKDDGCINILPKKQVIYDLAPAENTAKDDSTVITIPQNIDQLISGDILLKVKHKGSFLNSLICRI